MLQAQIPPEGFPVNYYRYGEKKDGPIPARVVKVSDKGNCELITFPVQGGMTQRRHHVRHIGDPHLLSHSQVRQNEGAWDWVEGLVHNLAPLIPPEGEVSDEERFSYISAAYEKGMSPAEVANVLGKDWTHQKVGRFMQMMREKLEVGPVTT